MNKFTSCVLFSITCCAFSASLGACSDTNAANVLNLGKSRIVLAQGLAFDQGGLVLTALGRATAHVNAEGDLRIGKKRIATTEAQHDLLRSYYAQAKQANSTLEALTNNAAAYGEQVANKLLSGLVDAHTRTKTGKNTRSELDAAGSRLCHEMRQLGVTQTQVQASTPSLEAYAAFRGSIDCGSSAANNAVAQS